MIVEKAYNMAKKMNIPVLGLVENYSYLECPDCGKKISVFGESHIDEIAEKLGVEVLGKMPIDPKLAEIVEQEKFYEADNQYLKNIIEQVQLRRKLRRGDDRRGFLAIEARKM